MQQSSKQSNASKGLRRGIYETDYGNAAYVGGPSAKTAFDLDMGERIPIEAVTPRKLRDAEAFDEAVAGD